MEFISSSMEALVRKSIFHNNRGEKNQTKSNPMQNEYKLVLRKDHSEIRLRCPTPQTNITCRFIDTSLMEPEWNSSRHCDSRIDTYGIATENKALVALEHFEEIKKALPAPVRCLALHSEIFTSEEDAKKILTEISKLEQVEILLLDGPDTFPFVLPTILNNLAVTYRLYVSEFKCIHKITFEKLALIHHVYLPLPMTTTVEEIMATAEKYTRIKFEKLNPGMCNAVLHHWLNSKECSLDRLTLYGRVEICENSTEDQLREIFKGLLCMCKSSNRVRFDILYGIYVPSMYSHGVQLYRQDGAKLTLFYGPVGPMKNFTIKAEYPERPSLEEQLPEIHAKMAKKQESLTEFWKKREDSKVLRARENSIELRRNQSQTTFDYKLCFLENNAIREFHYDLGRDIKQSSTPDHQHWNYLRLPRWKFEEEIPSSSGSGPFYPRIRAMTPTQSSRNTSNSLLPLDSNLLAKIVFFLDVGVIMNLARFSKKANKALHPIVNRPTWQKGVRMVLMEDYSLITLECHQSSRNYTWRFVNRNLLQKSQKLSNSTTYGVQPENMVLYVVRLFLAIYRVFPCPILQLLLHVNIFSREEDAQKIAGHVLELGTVRELSISSNSRELDYGAVERIIDGLLITETLEVTGFKEMSLKRFQKFSAIKISVRVPRDTTAKDIMTISAGRTQIKIPGVQVKLLNKLLHCWLASESCEMIRLTIKSRSWSSTKKEIRVAELFEGLNYVKGVKEMEKVFENTIHPLGGSNTVEALRIGFLVHRSDGAVLVVTLNYAPRLRFSLRAIYPNEPSLSIRAPEVRSQIERLYKVRDENVERAKTAKKSILELEEKLKEEETTRARGDPVVSEESKRREELISNISDMSEKVAEWRQKTNQSMFDETELEMDLTINEAARKTHGHFELPAAPSPPRKSICERILSVFGCKCRPC